jgi:hypothetical protein
MSIIEAVKTYLKTYTGLETGAPVWVDYLGPAPTGYAIIPLPGAKVVETYINGASVREFPFAFQSTESTADDPERTNTQAFYEAFADWMESQTEAGTLPSLGTKKTAESIEALGWGTLMEQGTSETGVYVIQCKLTYQQQP